MGGLKSILLGSAKEDGHSTKGLFCSQRQNGFRTKRNNKRGEPAGGKKRGLDRLEKELFKKCFHPCRRQKIYFWASKCFPKAPRVKSER